MRQNHWAELPEDWCEVFCSVHQQPSPFEVIEEKTCLKAWTIHFNKHYDLKKLLFPCKPFRKLKITEKNPVLIVYRFSHKGP